VGRPEAEAVGAEDEEWLQFFPTPSFMPRQKKSREQGGGCFCPFLCPFLCYFFVHSIYYLGASRSGGQGRRGATASRLSTDWSRSGLDGARDLVCVYCP